jgi:hypothetical protein
MQAMPKEDLSLSLRNDIEELREEAAALADRAKKTAQEAQVLTERIKYIERQITKKSGKAYENRSRPKGPRTGGNVDAPNSNRMAINKMAEGAKADKKRIPKIGDHVTLTGHHGAFVVSQLHPDNQVAKVKKIGTQTPILIVEWKDLGFLDELDESQNALRVGREATED